MIATNPNSIHSARMRYLMLGVYSHLKRRRKVQLIFLFLIMLVSGVAETLSLGLVVPFLAVLTDPDNLWKQEIVRIVAAHLEIKNASQLILPVSILFASTAVIAAIVRTTNLWLNNRLAAAIGSDLSCEAYMRTLYQPYSVHVQRNSSEIIASTTTMIARTVTSFSAFLQLVTATIATIFLIVALAYIDFSVALGTVCLFSLIYALITHIVRSRLRINSVLISITTKQQVKALQEGLGSVRDVLLDGNQLRYVSIYSCADIPLRKLISNNQFLSAFPRYAVEAFGIVAIALFGGIQVLNRGSGAEIVPLLGVLALGAQRLLPAFQQMYRSWSVISGFSADIGGVLQLLNQPLPANKISPSALQFKESIHFENISFSYGHGRTPVLNNLDLVIRRGDRIGLVGSTGSGKSTMVDILMGLLPPSSGRITVDGFDLNLPTNENILLSWRAAIAHVPQSIYLTDSTIAENIAFGEPFERIDYDLVRHSASMAQLDSFISTTVDGYQTFVGEQGVRLSGGQRQRIGIARALYKRASVLVLDEATSALDGLTEKEVMKSIEGLNRTLTVIIIAHRLSTLQRCDRVIRLNGGVVVCDAPPSSTL